MIHPLHTLIVEGTTILAWPTRKVGYRTIHLSNQDARRLDYRRGRRVFGYVSWHRVVRRGCVTPELVQVFTAGAERKRMLI